MWGTEMRNASRIRERASWTRASLQDEGCQADEHFSFLFPAPRAVLSWLADAPSSRCAQRRLDWRRLERDIDVSEDPK
jgi:hypothetical protein